MKQKDARCGRLFGMRDKYSAFLLLSLDLWNDLINPFATRNT
ncbi:hypothetical protein ACFL1R_01120 [Candidatus Latescibacterota bacterium]